jgi:hypothetical protein
MSREIVFSPLKYSGHRGYDDKTLFRKFLDTMTFGTTDKVEQYATRHAGRERVSTFLEMFREYSESGFAGGLLGLANATGNMEPMGIPLDGAGAGLGAVIKVFAGRDSHIGKTAGDIGMTCNGVYWYRAADRMMRAKKKLSAHGDWTDPQSDDSSWEGDPVIETSKEL